MRRDSLIVLKFGSSVLRNDSDFASVAHEIYRWVREGHRVIAVVSAMHNATNELLARAQACGSTGSEAAVAALLATGETASLSLLSLVLGRAGVPAVALDEAGIGLLTRGPILDAEPCSLDTQALLGALDKAPVVAVPGFIGRQTDGAISLLGRGGSDLSAIFIAQQIQAERCRLIKDVDGIFEFDPCRGGALPRRYRTLTWADAARVGDGVVQKKALDFAGRRGRFFEVAELNSDQPSLVCNQPASFYELYGEHAPLRVGLLGAGTVGLGVYRVLAAHPRTFEITRIAVRRLHREDGTPRELLTQDPWEAVDSGCDLVVELIGGLSPAKDLIAASLRAGKHVITANKMVMAHHGRELRSLAAQNGAQLLFSAAVGGAAPMLEQVRRIAGTRRIRSLRGVINGTANFVLNRLAEGASSEEAVRAAQVLGLAEQNPATDLDGSDAAHKLALLAQTAFGRWLQPDQIERTGIEGLNAESVRAAGAAGHSLRLIGSVYRDAQGIRASVRPQLVDRHHAFAQTFNEENCLEIHPEGGAPIYVRGKGAGRWPATESVAGDLFEMCRTRADAPQISCLEPSLNVPESKEAAAPASLGD